MNGVTGRMGYNQHLVRSVLAINADGGVELPSGHRVRREPVLVGRSDAKLAAIAKRHGIENWTTSLDEALDAMLLEQIAVGGARLLLVGRKGRIVNGRD